MVLIIVAGVLIGLLAGAVRNIVAWMGGKLRLDVQTFLYIPMWSIWLMIPIALSLLASVAELIAAPRKRWRDTWGAFFFAFFGSLFLAAWAASLGSGLILKYAIGWKDGPSPPVLPADPPKDP